MRQKARETKNIVKALGGQETINSGATFGDNDAKRDQKLAPLGYKGYSVEIKVTDKKSYSLKKETLAKTRKEALVSQRMPVMVIDINGFRCAVLGFDDFTGMISLLDGEFTDDDKKA